MLWFIVRDVQRGFPSTLGVLAFVGLPYAIYLHRRESTVAATVSPAGPD